MPRRFLVSRLYLVMLIVVVVGCRFYFKTATDYYEAKPYPQSLERGKNLVFNICAGCHYNERVKKFIGRPLNDLPKIAGYLYSANLTNSKLNGIPPQYKDAELFYLLKTGISRSGKFMPYMMRPMMADQDINDIIIYLRSGDAPVSAIDTTVGKTHINFLGRTGMRFVTKPQAYNKGVSQPNEGDAVTYGRYLVAIIGCYHCHSGKTIGLNYSDPEKSKQYLSGGMKLKGANGERIFSPNLTPDNETGIGNFSKEDFRKAVREGITPSGNKLRPPMGKFKSLTDKQVDAIYAYLRTVTPVHNERAGKR